MLCCWILFPAEAAEPQRIKPQKLFVLFRVFRGSKYPNKIPPRLLISIFSAFRRRLKREEARASTLPPLAPVTLGGSATLILTF